MDTPTAPRSCTQLPRSKVLPERSTEMLRNTGLGNEGNSQQSLPSHRLRWDEIRSLVVGLETTRRVSGAPRSVREHAPRTVPVGGGYAETFTHPRAALARGRYYKEDATAQCALSFLQKQNKEEEYFVSFPCLHENNIILITVCAS